MQTKELRSLHLCGVMAGSGGLVASLFHLDREPLFAVLGMLGAMALVLGALAKLCDDGGAE